MQFGSGIPRFPVSGQDADYGRFMHGLIVVRAVDRSPQREPGCLSFSLLSHFMSFSFLSPPKEVS